MLRTCSAFAFFTLSRLKDVCSYDATRGPLIVHEFFAEYKTVKAVQGPLVILDKVKVSQLCRLFGLEASRTSCASKVKERGASARILGSCAPFGVERC
jgi:hypothetical protein